MAKLCHQYRGAVRQRPYPWKRAEGSAYRLHQHLKMFHFFNLKRNKPQHRQCVVPIRQMRKQTQSGLGNALGPQLPRRAEAASGHSSLDLCVAWHWWTPGPGSLLWEAVRLLCEAWAVASSACLEGLFHKCPAPVHRPGALCTELLGCPTLWRK